MQRVRAWPRLPRRHSSRWALAAQPPCPLSTGMSNHEAFTRVDYSGYRMPCPPECPPSAHRLMLACWHRDPEQRPCFQALRKQLCSFTSYENPI